MFPFSRSSRVKLGDRKAQHKTTADFHLPLQTNNTNRSYSLYPYNLRQQTYPPPLLLSNKSDRSLLSTPTVWKNELQPHMRLDQEDVTWMLDLDCNWLLSLTSTQFSLIRGSVHFRSKSFGNWEPFEFMRHFVIEKSAILGKIKKKFVEPLFLQDKSLPQGLVEMTLKLEYLHLETNSSEESLLIKHKAKMINASFPTPPISDLCINVGSEKFLVHIANMKAFSKVSDVLSKYLDKSQWDWSDIMTPVSMRALLRFIYYDEVESINTPSDAFHILRFSHMYEVDTLVKICSQKLKSFSDDKYKLPDVFDMYLFARSPVEFQTLKRFFCGVISRNVKKYDTNKLKTLPSAQGYDPQLVVEALVEILQFHETVPLVPRKVSLLTDM